MVQTIVVVLGGIFCLLVLVRFVRSLWRKPPDQPGSNCSTARPTAWECRLDGTVSRISPILRPTECVDEAHLLDSRARGFEQSR